MTLSSIWFLFKNTLGLRNYTKKYFLYKNCFFKEKTIVISKLILLYCLNFMLLQKFRV